MSLVFAAVAAACAPTVGPRSSCDDDLARTVVYDHRGSPAYFGQALLIQSCGFGSYCHTPGISLAERYGVPAGLDFVALPVRDTGARDVADRLARLHATRGAIHRNRNLIWASVLDGSMPPRGAAGGIQPDPARNGYFYWRLGAEPARGEPIPGIDDPEAQELLRNWLACGAPVVDRTAPLEFEPPCTTDADCPITGVCAGSVCEHVGDEVLALEVSFSTFDFDTIYRDILRPSCAVATGCHGAHFSAELDLSEPEIAIGEVNGLRTPVADNSPATGALCGGSRFAGLPRVVPGNPERSLLYAKLVGGTGCGEVMPFGVSDIELTAEEIDAVRIWIECSRAPGDTRALSEECCLLLSTDPDPEACCTPTDTSCAVALEW